MNNTFDAKELLTGIEKSVCNNERTYILEKSISSDEKVIICEMLKSNKYLLIEYLKIYKHDITERARNTVFNILELYEVLSGYIFIDADFSYLDLRNCNLSKFAFKNCNFNGSYINENNLFNIGHKSAVISAIYNKTCKKVLSTDNDGLIIEWDIEKNLVLKSFSSISVNTIYSFDETEVIQLCRDGVIKSVNLLTGSTNIIFDSASTYPFTTPIYNIDGSKIVVAYSDNTIKEHDSRSGKIVNSFAAHKGRINSLTYNRNKSKLLSASSDGTIKEWNAITGKIVQEINIAKYNPKSTNILQATYNYDDDRILFLIEGFEIKEFDNKAKKIIRTIDYSFPLKQICYNTDGSKILGTDYSNDILVWDSNNMLEHYKGHTGAINSISHNYCNKKIISCSSDGSIREWDDLGNTNKIFKGSNEHINNLFYNYDDSAIIYVDECGGLKEHCSKTYCVKSFVHAREQIKWASYGTKKILITHKDNSVSELKESALKPIINENIISKPIYNKNESKILTLINKNNVNSINQYDSLTGNLIKEIKSSDFSSFTCTNYSSTGHKIVSCSWDGAVNEWDADTGEKINDFELERKLPFQGILYSNDDTKILLYNSEKIIVYDMKKGKVLKTIYIENQRFQIIPPIFSSDDTKILTASDNTIIEYDAFNGTVINKYYGHEGYVTSIAYNKTSTIILSAASDSTIKQWDTKNISCISTLNTKKCAYVKNCSFDNQLFNYFYNVIV